MGFVEGVESFFRNIGLLNMDAKYLLMIMLGLFFAYLAIVKKFEPLLLLPLAFGILIANLPMVGLSAYDDGIVDGIQVRNPGLLYFLYQGIAKVIYPPMVFLCIGAMTDFAPMIASP
jgi:oxaloacetate decarboxylase beta subunit